MPTEIHMPTALIYYFHVKKSGNLYFLAENERLIIKISMFFLRRGDIMVSSFCLHNNYNFSIVTASRRGRNQVIRLPTS